MKKIGILFIVFLLTNCNGAEEKIDMIELPEQTKLKSSITKIQGFILEPYHMIILDNLLIICDNDDKNYFKVFHLPGLEYLYSWGTKGRGPDEFLYLHHDYMKVLDDNIFEVLDNGTIKGIKVYYDRMELVYSHKLPTLKNPINRLQKVKDSIYFIDNIDGTDNMEHCIIDIRKNVILSYFGEYPKTKIEGFKKNMNYQLFVKDNASNNQLGKFVSFYSHFNLIKIYNINGSLLRTVRLKDVDHEVKRFNDVVDRLYYLTPYSSNDFFSIMKFNMFQREFTDDLSNVCPNLLIFDWEGAIIGNFKLDKPIVKYAINNNRRVMYGIAGYAFDEICVYYLSD
jgi:hypothetical protein